MNHFTAIYRSNPRDWTAAQLAPLTVKQLGIVAQLLGVPFTGTKPQIIARLIDAADLRGVLADYGEHAAPLAAAYKGRDLRALCKRAGVYTGSTKYAMAAALLNWRNSCRERGQTTHAAIQAARRTRPKQLQLDFWCVLLCIVCFCGKFKI